jgi:O-antigen ligase
MSATLSSSRAPHAPRLEGVVFALALLQCVLAPIPHVTALANLTFYPLLVCVFALAYIRRATLRIAEPITAAVLALTILLIVASVIGPYPAESLNAWRKDYLPSLTVFVALVLTASSPRRTMVVLVAVVAGVAIRLSLIAVELWILNRPLLADSAGFLHPYTQVLFPSSFYGGFAIGAAVVSPLIAATLLRKDLPLSARLLAWYSLAGAIFLVVDYGSRTPFLAMCCGLLVVLLITLNRRTGALFVVTLSVMAAYTYWHKPGLITRYESIASAQTYDNGTPGQGITIGDRLRIWKGIVEICNERPAIGYGYGWKKLSYVVRDEGFLDRWKSDPNVDGFTSAYFSRGYGGINPHNLVVHLYFEGGVLGLVLFAALLSAVFLGVRRLLRVNYKECRSLGILAVGFFFSWLVANVGNSLWAGEKLPFVVMALMVAALARVPTDGGEIEST